MDGMNRNIPKTDYRIPPPPPPSEEPPAESQPIRGRSRKVNIQYFIPSAPRHGTMKSSQKDGKEKKRDQSSESGVEIDESGKSSDQSKSKPHGMKPGKIEKGPINPNAIPDIPDDVNTNNSTPARDRIEGLKVSPLSIPPTQVPQPIVTKSTPSHHTPGPISPHGGGSRMTSSPHSAQIAPKSPLMGALRIPLPQPATTGDKAFTLDSSSSSDNEEDKGRSNSLLKKDVTHSPPLAPQPPVGSPLLPASTTISSPSKPSSSMLGGSGSMMGASRFGSSMMGGPSLLNNNNNNKRSLFADSPGSSSPELEPSAPQPPAVSGGGMLNSGGGMLSSGGGGGGMLSGGSLFSDSRPKALNPTKSRFFSTFGVDDLLNSDEDLTQPPPPMDSPLASDHEGEEEEEQAKKEEMSGRERRASESKRAGGLKQQIPLSEAIAEIKALGEKKSGGGGGIGSGDEQPNKKALSDMGTVGTFQLDEMEPDMMGEQQIDYESSDGSDGGNRQHAVGLKRVQRFWKESILIDKSNDLNKAVRVKAGEKMIQLSGDIVGALKKDKEQVNELDMNSMISTIRSMLVLPESLVRCSALRLLRYILTDQNAVIVCLKSKVHLLVIMCLERSEKFHYERDCALRIVNLLVEKHAALIPRSIYVSIISIAGDHSDPIHYQCLCILRSLLSKNPDEVMNCGGVIVLLNGCMKERNSNLLQSSLMACLYFLNEYKYRQKRTLLDIQVIFDPLSLGSDFSQDFSSADLDTARSLANLSVLTIMKSWSGIFVFGGEFGGLNNYINLISTHVDEPKLVREMLLVIYSLLGLPLPPVNDETGSFVTSERSSVYWTNCSLFIDKICSINSSGVIHSAFNKNINLLTCYCAFVLWSLVNSALPETLAMLILSRDEEIAAMSDYLLRMIVLMCRVFSSMNERMVKKTLKSSILSFQNRIVETEEEMRRYNSARTSFADISISSRYLYPIIESKSSILCSLTDAFSQAELLNSVVDCLCDESIAQPKSFAVFESVCDKAVPFQKFVVENARSASWNDARFDVLLKYCVNSSMNQVDRWDFYSLTQLMFITVQKPEFIHEFYKSQLMQKIGLFFGAMEDWTFMAPHLPINRSSFLLGMIFACYLMITIAVDTDLCPLSRKQRNLQMFYYEVFVQLEEAQKNNESGLFCTHALLYTNSSVMLHILVRFMFTSRLSTILNLRNDLATLTQISTAADYPNSNTLVIRYILNYIDIRYDTCTAQRDCLASFCDNGSSSIKLLCLSRIRSTFRDMNGSVEYAQWAIPVVLRQVAFNISVTVLVIDILYETSQYEDNLFVLIQSLKNLKDVDRKQILLTLTRTESAELLLYSIMSMEEGITMINESCDNYLTTLIGQFMSEGIFDYVFKLEDELTHGIMQNPSLFSKRLVKVDNDPTLQVKPLKLQPTSDIVYSMLRSDSQKTEWLMRLPWRIAIALIEGDKTTYLDVLTQVDFGTRSSTDSLTNSPNLVLRGFVVDKDFKHESFIKFPAGSELRAYLFLGSECVSTSSDCADFTVMSGNARASMSSTTGVVTNTSSRGLVTRTTSADDELKGVNSESTSGKSEAEMTGDRVNNPVRNYWKYLNHSSIKRRHLMGEMQCGVSKARALTIHEYMMSQDQVRGQYQAVSFAELEKRISSMFAAHELNGAVFRLCRENGCCAWKFIVPEGDFKIADISLGRAVSLAAVEFVIDLIPHKPQRIPVGPHLFNVFFSSPSGRRFLNDFVVLSDITHIIMDPYKSLIDRRAALWAISHIACQEDGIEFLKGNASVDFIPALIDIIQNDPYLSFRGSAYLALSFTSSCIDTHEDIERSGWVTESDNGSCVCYPSDIRKLSRSGVVSENWRLPSCDHFFSPESKSITHSFTHAVTTVRPVTQASTACSSDVVLSKPPTADVVQLCNLMLSLNSGVMNHDVKVQLEETKRKQPHLFQSPTVLCTVHHMLSISSFPRGWRKFIFQLFGDMTWTDGSWTEYDSVASHHMREGATTAYSNLPSEPHMDNEMKELKLEGEEDEEEANDGAVVSYMNFYGNLSQLNKSGKGGIYGGNKGVEASTDDGGSYTSFNSFNRIYGGPYPTSQSSFSEN